MIIRAQSPANFAEEYIIKNIWNNHFPPGSILPAERKFSELIGVTRTTLREVLQRLARDGWLTIQHGKPTKVNNFWETSSLNILETVARLDRDGVSKLIEDLLSVRTNISAIFIRTAFYNDKLKSLEILSIKENIENSSKSFTVIDYNIFRGLAFISGNSIYGLILNGLKGLYIRIGRYYFSDLKARQLAYDFYHDLTKICKEENYDQVLNSVCRYGKESNNICRKMKDKIINDLSELC
ncbi:MAG: fatty acid metabolism transcriptional regulator FadR [Arsenophonus sp. ET-YP4-MAG3]